jgi:hypothetical protein
MVAMVAEDKMHPSLAPLYYLYETTLLYSVKEGDDDVVTTHHQAQQWAQAQAAPHATTPTPATADTNANSNADTNTTAGIIQGCS